MTGNLRIVVVGGSLGGLLAGNILHRAGFDVTVHERIAVPLDGRGAGIAAHPELFDAFERAGVNVNDAIGTSVEDRYVFAQDGSVANMLHLPQTMCAWGSLLRLLQAAFPPERYFTGMPFVHAEPRAGAVAARFGKPDGNDLTEIQADVLVGADGLYSTVRELFWPGVRPVYAGYIVWRGMVDEARVSPATHAALFERYSFCLPPGEHALGYPIPGADGDVRPGRRRFNFVWYRRVEEATELKDLMTDETGHYHAAGIPPGMLQARHVAAFRAAAEQVLAPQFCEIAQLIKTPFFQSVMDMDAPGMVSGRVATLGDAPFLVRPHCGMGVTKAAGDAVALADALTAHPGQVDAALAAYDMARSEYGRALTLHSRKLGSQMKTTYASDEERDEAAFYRKPETCLRQISYPPERL